MHTPSASALLQAWEKGAEASSAARGIWLLEASCEDLDVDALLGLPLGKRDALLIDLRKRLFGRHMQSIARCPACGETAEADLDTDGLAQGTPPGAAIHEIRPGGGDTPIRFRLPDTRDLMAIQSSDDAEAARDILIERCVIGGADNLPNDVQQALARAMADADPQADLSLAFTCPACRHAWEPVFDIARFLWQEVHAWALRMLRDVDTLARSYHWSEADILAMSPRRRQAYLEQCVS
jgi:hypothetical protein